MDTVKGISERDTKTKRNEPNLPNVSSPAPLDKINRITNVTGTLIISNLDLSYRCNFGIFFVPYFASYNLFLRFIKVMCILLNLV